MPNTSEFYFLSVFINKLDRKTHPSAIHNHGPRNRKYIYPNWRC